MKKTYTLSIILFLLSALTVKAEDVALVSSYTLYDLTSDRLNSSYTDSQGNSFSLITNEPTAANGGRMVYYSDIDTPLECAGENNTGLDSPVNPEGYTRVILQGKGSARPVRSPFIVIDLGESTTIREIQLMGSAAGGTEGDSDYLIYCFSSEGDTDVDYYLPDNDEPFEFIVGSCNYNNLRIVIPAGTRYVKLIVTDEYVGHNIASSYSNPPMLTALRFFAEDIPNSISESSDTQFELIQRGTEVTANEMSDFMVYSLSGVALFAKTNTESVDLSHLSNGLYIVKAISNVSGEVQAKKVWLSR